mgnify:CR=1 FL=1
MREISPPVKIDPGIHEKAINRKGLEQVIKANILPIVENIVIHPIALNNGNSIYLFYDFRNGSVLSNRLDPADALGVRRILAIIQQCDAHP